ncbi:MAG: hypothetical protein WBO10_00150 [Pyrinomonadaceae bacterium]
MNIENIQFNRGSINAVECVSSGWEIIKPNYMMFVGGVLIVALLGCIPVASWFLLGPLLVGVYAAMLKQYRGENADFGMLFSGFSKFFPALVIGIIFMLPTILLNTYNLTLRLVQLLAVFNPNELTAGAATAFWIFGILLNLFVFIGSVLCWISFVFAMPLLAEHDLSIMETIRLSIRAGWANVGGLILLMLLIGLMLIGGVLALCIGIFFVLPIVYAAITVAYRQVFPIFNNPQGNMSSPENYGTMPGQAQQY